MTFHKRIAVEKSPKKIIFHKKKKSTFKAENAFLKHLKCIFLCIPTQFILKNFFSELKKALKIIKLLLWF